MLAKGSATERYSDAESGDRKREKEDFGVRFSGRNGRKMGRFVGGRT